MDFSDTSFLLSLEGDDANSAAAVAHAEGLGQPIIITKFLRLEFENAPNLLRFRGEIDQGEAASTLAAFESDEATGRIRMVPCAWPAVLHRALWSVAHGRQAKGIDWLTSCMLRRRWREGVLRFSVSMPGSVHWLRRKAWRSGRRGLERATAFFHSRHGLSRATLRGA